MNTENRPASYPLRLEPEIRAKLEATAKTNGRSLNAEISMRLEESLSLEPYAIRLTKTLKEKLTGIAEANGRSLSAEMLFRLEASLEGVLVRPSAELRQNLERAAYTAERSLQAEILMRLQHSLSQTKILEEAPPGSVIETLEQRMHRIALETYLELDERMLFSNDQQHEILRLIHMVLYSLGIISIPDEIDDEREKGEVLKE